MFPVCEKYGIGFIAYSPLAQGFLAGRPFHPNRQVKDVRKHHDLYKTGAWQRIGEGKEDAFRFLLEKKQVTSFLVSMTKPSHVRENVDVVRTF